MKLQDHIEYIRNRCIDAIANNDKMSVASFESGEGLIMTFNEAIEIVNHIDELKKEKAELLEALKNIMPFVYPLAYPGREAAANAAKAAIENVEKTKQ
jgi:hypothetical protein